ncbi:MAG: GNAT family N-acetyltransferase [Pseudomonadota bacterium]
MLPEDFEQQWAALSLLAAPNVFMCPAALRAVWGLDFARLKVFCAWLEGHSTRRLIGFWALQRASLTPVGPAFLSAPPYSYAFVSSPVLDREHVDLAMNRILDNIELDERLPKVMRLRYLDGDCPSYTALVRALHERGARMFKVSQHERPVVTRQGALQKSSGATRKKLRQKWRRLTALGNVEVLDERAPAAVQKAFEIFLQMEHAGWKGSAGTSLLSDVRDAAFARRLIAELSQQACASVALLTLNHNPVAAQVLLRCGSVAYTWKTAFDAEYRALSPGALLVDKITEQIFASETIESIESCSPEGSFMNHLWHERRSTVEMVVHLGARYSIDYTAVSVGARSYAQLRDLRDKLRAMAPSMLKGRGASIADGG